MAARKPPEWGLLHIKTALEPSADASPRRNVVNGVKGSAPLDAGAV